MFDSVVGGWSNVGVSVWRSVCRKVVLSVLNTMLAVYGCAGVYESVESEENI
jgi:hypothetical protein